MSADYEMGLDTETRRITWPVTYEVRCGWRRCDGCRKRTPDPTDSDLIELAKNGRIGSGNFVWAMDQYTPRGWSCCGDLGILCPECIDAARKALVTRRAMLAAAVSEQ